MKAHSRNLKECNTKLNDRKYLKIEKTSREQNRNNQTTLKGTNQEIYVELSDTSDNRKYRKKIIATSRLPPSKLPEMATLKRHTARVKTNETTLKQIDSPSNNYTKAQYRKKFEYETSKNEDSTQEDDSDSEPNFGKRKLPIRYSRATRYFNLLDIIKTGGNIRPIVGDEFLYGNKIWEDSESDYDWDPRAIYGENANSVLKCLQSESESNSEEEEEEEDDNDEEDYEKNDPKENDAPSISLEVSLNGDSDGNSKKMNKTKIISKSNTKVTTSSRSRRN